MENSVQFIRNSRLAYFIVEYLGSDFVNWNDKNIINASEWLALSSGVNLVNIEPIICDESCSSVYEYEKERCKIWSELSVELVKFHFVWGALENIILSYVPKEKIKIYGKVNALCGFLKNAKLKEVLPKYYLNEFSDLLYIVKQNEQYNDDLNKLGMLYETKYNYKNYVDESGIGIFVVYKIRNMFAHGIMKLPESEEYSGEKEKDVLLIKHSIRIVLMTILIILINDIKNNNWMIIEKSPLFSYVEVPLIDYLRCLPINVENNN